jgi:hypothetical protein
VGEGVEGRGQVSAGKITDTQKTCVHHTYHWEEAMATGWYGHGAGHPRQAVEAPTGQPNPRPSRTRACFGREHSSPACAGVLWAKNTTPVGKNKQHLRDLRDTEIKRGVLCFGARGGLAVQGSTALLESYSHVNQIRGSTARNRSCTKAQAAHAQSSPASHRTERCIR